MNDATDLVADVAASRILVIDDNQAIHQDFRKIFGASRSRSAPSAAELALLGGGSGFTGVPEFQIDSAYQGQEGLALVRLAQEQHRPYAMAFVDVRMPPGWDGIETTARIWQHDPDIQIVICTAFSDYSWSEMLAKLGRSDRLVILKKPFDTIEVVQLASALSEKWRLARQSRSMLEGLERTVAERTSEVVHASERLQASEAQYRLLFDSNPHPMWVYDIETLRFVMANDAAVECYGYSEQQFLAMTIRDIRPAESVATLEKHIDEQQRQGKRFAETRHRKRDGSLIDVEVSSDRIVFNGRPARLVLAHDVTQRTQAAIRIKRLNRVHAVLSGINSLIVRAGDRDELFREACRIAIEHGGFRMAWIGVMDKEAGIVKPMASAGEVRDFFDSAPLAVIENKPGGHGLTGRVIRDMKPVVSNDVRSDPQRLMRRELEERGINSLAVIPLIVGGKAIGVLALYSADKGFFDDKELRLLQELAGNISFALDHIEKEQKVRRLTRVHAVLTGINAAIVRIPDREALFRESCRIAFEAGQLRLAWIGIVDAQREEILPVAVSGPEQGMLKIIRLSTREDGERFGLAGRAIRDRAPAVSNDVLADERARFGVEGAQRGFRSVAMIPLIVDGAAVGAFGLHAAEAGFFDDDEMNLLKEVAGNIGFALEHIEKEEKVQRLTRVHAVLSGINALIVRVGDRDELFREACRVAVEQGNFAMSWIGTFDPATQDVTAVAWAGESAEELTRAKSSAREDTPRGAGAVGQSIRARRPIFNNNIQTQSFGGPRLKEILRLGFQSHITLPLYEGQAVVATLTLYTRERNFFVEEELRLLTGLAADISFALENISRQRKLDKLARIRAVSGEINAAIIRIHEGEALLRETYRIAVEHGKFELAWLAFIDQEKRHIRALAWAGFSAEIAHAVKWSYLDDPRLTLNEIVRTRRPAVRNDIEADAPAGTLRQEASRLGCQSTVCLPFVVDEKVVAAIILFARGRGFFDTEELALLNEVAANVSLALEHIEKEQKVRRLTRVYAVLSGINTLIVRVRDREELFREACRIAVEVGGLRMSLIGIVERSALVPVASAGKDEELMSAIKGILSSSSGAPGTMVARTIREKKAVVSNDSQSDPRVLFGKKYAESGVRSMAILPLIVADEAIGVLALYADTAGFFDEEEMKLLTELAGDIAFALEHIEEAEKLDRMTRVNAMLSGINGAIVRIRARQELFEEACRIAVETGGLRFAWLAMVDEAEMRLRSVASAGTLDGFLETIRDRLSLRDDAPAGHGIGAKAVRERRAWVVNDLEADADLSYKNAYADRGIKAVAALPLFIAGRVVGAFGLHAAQAGFFDDDEMRLLNEVAGNIAFALEHIEKEEKVERLTRVYAVLSGINSLIVRVGDRDELFRGACQIAVSEGGFLLARVLELDSNGRARIAATSESDPRVYQRIIDEYNLDPEHCSSLVGLALRGGQPLISNDVANDPRIPDRAALTKDGNYALALLPLIVEKRITGAVILRASETGAFNKDELHLLLELVANLSFALELMDKQQKLDYLSYYDALTGLANRSLFVERLAQYMRSAVSGGHKLALYLIDLERFKNINDSLGQPAGDALLKQVAQWLTRNLGDASLLARLEADHFAVVLPEVRRDGDVAQLLEKTMAAFLQRPFQLNDAVFRIAAKVGAAIFPDDGADASTLFRNAEAALKKAKASGDRYLFYTQTMTETVGVKLTLENQLRQAIDKREFVLHYQPKVNLASGKLTSAEALIRWNDPRTGLVPPGRFIPVLEETGLIYEVGRWALRKAVEEYLRWRTAGLAAVRIAVNVSPLQLRNRDFIAEIKQAIGIDAHAAAGLELEITESLIMEDVKNSIVTLKAIRDMGVTIAIDDFGTGFSSLSYLSKLPVDTLKIDRSFVIDMTAGAEGLALVSTIITLAHSLKLKVVAEGVETEEQARLLRLLSCDEMQGYLFSKPVPSEIFETRFLAPPPAG